MTDSRCADLVSYNSKHNEANGDENRDGTENNDSWNMGAEGPTDDEEINRLRERQMRNFLATLLLSQGVPMIAGGDEVGRSQRGNNNCYCQDNELTWFDWDLDPPRKRLLDFTRQLIHFRLRHPNLHRRKFFQDRVIRKKNELTVIQDIAWFNTDGSQVTDEVWNAEWSRCIGLLLNGQTLEVTDDEGRPVVDDTFLILVNAAAEGVEFTLPPAPSGRHWCQQMDTENLDDPFAQAENGDKVILGGRSLRLYSDALVNPGSRESRAASREADESRNRGSAVGMIGLSSALAFHFMRFR